MKKYNLSIAVIALLSSS